MAPSCRTFNSNVPGGAGNRRLEIPALVMHLICKRGRHPIVSSGDSLYVNIQAVEALVAERKWRQWFASKHSRVGTNDLCMFRLFMFHHFLIFTYSLGNTLFLFRLPIFTLTKSYFLIILTQIIKETDNCHVSHNNTSDCFLSENN